MTERDEPVDRRHEEALSAALHEHARTVRPAGDGLVRIRSRVQRRRLRVRFLAPLASVAAAAAAVTAIVASGLFTSTPDRSVNADVSTTRPAATTTATTPAPVAAKTLAPSIKPSASVAPASSTAPPVAIPSSLASTPPTTTTVVGTHGPTIDPPVWPFATVAEAAGWQQTSSQKPNEAWHLDARSVAERFVSTLMAGLGLPHFSPTGTTPVVNPDGTETVDVTRVGLNGSTLVLGTVKLARWGSGADSPWGVVSVTSPAKSKFPLSIKAPLSRAQVGSPLAVSIGMVGGAEDDVYTSAWSTGASTPGAKNHDVLATDKVETLTTGVPTTGTGFVAVLDGSTGAGAFGLARVAVTPVRYGTGGGSTVVEAAKTYVVAAVTKAGNVLQVRDASSDRVVRTLASGQRVTSAKVSDDGQWVYYVAQGSEDCSAGTAWRTRLDGTGSPEPLAAAKNGAMTIGIAGAQAQQLAYVSGSCATHETINWTTAIGSGSFAAGPVVPPDVQSVALSPDGGELSAFVRTGNQGNVMTFDLGSAKSLADAATVPACRTIGRECVGVVYAPNGDVLTVTSDGSTFVVQRQHNGTVVTLFGVTGEGQGATLDTDATGTRVLLTDNAGHGWMWSGSGKARALPGHVIDASS